MADCLTKWILQALEMFIVSESAFWALNFMKTFLHPQFIPESWDNALSRTSSSHVSSEEEEVQQILMCNVVKNTWCSGPDHKVLKILKVFLKSVWTVRKGLKSLWKLFYKYILAGRWNRAQQGTDLKCWNWWLDWEKIWISKQKQTMFPAITLLTKQTKRS